MVKIIVMEGKKHLLQMRIIPDRRKRIVENLFSNSNYIGNTLTNSKEISIRHSIYFTKYVGTEDGIIQF